MNDPTASQFLQSMQITSSDAAPQLALLRLLESKSDLSQRELSRSLGLSLGKTHYVLHALLNKGLVKARNFTRSDNKLGYSYFLTPAGMAEKLRMTREFLGRKELEFEQLKTAIAALRAEVVDGAADLPVAAVPAAETNDGKPAPARKNGRAIGTTQAPRTTR